MLFYLCYEMNLIKSTVGRVKVCLLLVLVNLVLWAKHADLFVVSFWLGVLSNNQRIWEH